MTPPKGTWVFMVLTLITVTCIVLDLGSLNCVRLLAGYFLRPQISQRKT